jgi:hypothetical protein
MLTRLHPERIAAASHVPTAGCDLTQLTNDELIAGTRRLVAASNQVLAMLLAHLAEVEARGIHRQRACSSLYTYCIYELRFSEDAAYRRVSAARLVKRFPALYEAIASGELHLTGLLLLGPHLTPENHLGVLGRAKHRTKKELGKGSDAAKAIAWNCIICRHSPEAAGTSHPISHCGVVLTTRLQPRKTSAATPCSRAEQARDPTRTGASRSRKVLLYARVITS